MAKILIAVPTFETIYPDTYKSIYEIDKGDNEVLFEFVRGYDIATARNRIAQKSLDLECDYVLMVDNDVVVPKDVLTLMLENPVDVCLGVYAHRGPDNIYRGKVCVCRLKDDRGQDYFNYPLESAYSASEIIKFAQRGEKKKRIHGGGMGCAFINTFVFKAIDYPWYDWVNYGDANRGMLSEDLYFCERCKAKTIPVFTDVRVRCGHMFRHVQYLDG